MNQNHPDYQTTIIKLKMLMDCRQVLVKNGYVGNRDLLPGFCTIFSEVLGNRLRFDNLIPQFSDNVPGNPKELKKRYISLIQKFNLAHKAEEDADIIKAILLELWGVIEMLFITTKLELKTPDVLPSDYEKFSESSIIKLRNTLDILKPVVEESEMECVAGFYKKAYDHLQSLVSDKIWVGMSDYASKKNDSRKQKLRYMSPSLRHSDHIQQQQLISLIEDFPYLLSKLHLLLQHNGVKARLISFQSFVRFVSVFFVELQKRGFSPTYPYSTVNLSIKQLKQLENSALFETGSLLMKSPQYFKTSFSRWMLHHLRFKTVQRLWGIYTLMLFHWKKMPCWPHDKMSNYRPTISDESMDLKTCFDKVLLILQKYAENIPVSHDNIGAIILDSFKTLKMACTLVNAIPNDKLGLNNSLPSSKLRTNGVTEAAGGNISVVCSSLCIPHDTESSARKLAQNSGGELAKEKCQSTQTGATKKRLSGVCNIAQKVPRTSRRPKTTEAKYGGSNCYEESLHPDDVTPCKKSVSYDLTVKSSNNTLSSPEGKYKKKMLPYNTLTNPFNKTTIVEAIESIRSNLKT